MQIVGALRPLLCGLFVLGAVFATGRWFTGSAPVLLTTAVLSGATGKLYQARQIRKHPGVRRFSRELPQPRPYPTPMLHNESCARWCVFTTINPPTAPVTQCASLRGWCVVVVGDKKSPPAYKVPKGAGKVVYLDPAAQRALPYRILRLLPWNHFGRKNLGYVYAIHHGAKVILDIDDDNELLPSAKLAGGLAPRLALLTHIRGTAHSVAVPEWHVPSGTAAFNPYPYFRMRADDATPEEEARYPAWPRGFPLNGVLDPTTRPQPRANSSTSTAWPSSRQGQPQLGCIQLLADHDPDVDAIFRLSRRLPQSFGERQALLTLPAGTMAPFNAQALLVARAAFWGLLLPVSVNGRVSDIWRSYSWQRLMWNAELGLAFSSPLIKQVRNVHSYLADLNAELPLYERAGELIALLTRLPLRTAHLPGQIEEVVITLYEYGILELADVELTQAFLVDLINIGYEFPPITLKPRRCRGQASDTVVYGGLCPDPSQQGLSLKTLNIVGSGVV